MSGRGRGRGSTLSLTQDQLQAMGIGRGEVNAPTLDPPPLFPKLESKPLPLPSDAATDYMLIVKQQFVEHMRESPAHVIARTVVDDVERYSDKYKLLTLDAKRSETVECVWSNVPAELRPHARQNRLQPRKRKLEGADAIAERLQTLEKKEMREEREGEGGAGGREGAVRPENSDDEALEEEQEYEADDGTDYANNYFDNGEEFDDEDDNLDDGPVY